MSKHIIEYPLNNGNSIWVETQTTQSDIQRISTIGGKESSSKKFEDAVHDIEPATNAVIGLMKNMGIVEGQLEVGLKFSAKAGVILASADSEATFKITMKWKPT